MRCEGQGDRKKELRGEIRVETERLYTDRRD
jgi:hypothetical protein